MRAWALLLGLLPAPPVHARAGDPPICPMGFAADASRTDAIARRLRAAGRSLDGIAVCFAADAEPEIVDGRMILLPDAMTIAESAARAAHLLHHARVGSPLRVLSRSRRCDSWVNDVVREENAARDVERAMLRNDGNGEPRFLESVVVLAARYAARCREESGR